LRLPNGKRSIPFAMPAPPLPERGGGVLTRVAARRSRSRRLAAFFMVSTAPLSFPSAVKAETEPSSSSLWSRLMGRGARQPVHEAAVTAAPLADRFRRGTPQPKRRGPSAAGVTPPQPKRARHNTAARATAGRSATAGASGANVAVRSAPLRGAAPRPRTLERDRSPPCNRRSEELISQGDIAGGGCLLTRAAEAGDARSALRSARPTIRRARQARRARVKPDAEKARALYAPKASEFRLAPRRQAARGAGAGALNMNRR